MVIGAHDRLIRQSVERFDAYASAAFKVGLQLGMPGANGDGRCVCGLSPAPEESAERCRAFADELATAPEARRRCPRGLQVVAREVAFPTGDRRLLASHGFLEAGDATPLSAGGADAAPLPNLPLLTAEQIRNLEGFLHLAADLLGTVARSSRNALGESAREELWLEERGAFSIVGVSPAVAALREALPNYANSREPLFLDVEPGNGRHLIASVLHRLGPRRDQPFLAENLAVLPESLQEIELFGREGGGGLLAEARGGTLLLSGVERLTEESQSRLSDYLAGGTPASSGRRRGPPPETRIIATVAVNLDEAVRRKRFRSDLARQLTALTLRLPPLRERPEDIPLLVEHLLHRRAAVRGAEPCAVDPEALEALKKYPWPGNVRELDEALARAASYRAVIRVEDIEGRIARVARPPKPLHTGLRQAVGELEAELIARTLADTDWNKSRSARILGLSRLGLQKKIDRYDLDRRR